jgi:gamma-glutamylcyclotransferase (GGCT)/AIG2-like uncharacterized protein YtfP
MIQRNMPFFVYGTLIPGQENYPRFLAGRTLQETPSSIRGAVLYTEGRYPYLVVDSTLAQPSDEVSGYLIHIKPHLYDAVLEHVDQLEGYRAYKTANWYERVCREIQTERGNVRAWVYVAGVRLIGSLRVGLLRRMKENSWRQNPR